ncbi:MAG: LLM class F420-dependent oxidoreductase [Dietzia sp.]|uniref:LLM class F420-dependent oxidoreductase n=2 Tax=Dietzia TaxID=37914 RepID=A0ABP4UBH3_9ACTN|nr:MULTISPECIES: LLM class F420-dependent oxidoreductase [Dietzia]MBB1034019.1 LLM class F420-dependent oxidoreductase [Dietzia sp. CQ4]MBB1038371.1 LLM class F420-dependent oxidoreductase [Dietzia natronolimnaea]MBB1042126.1 LLM class F420-dependent oxidoreductase [Dietzia sp. Cai40]MBB1046215.1 LLM class F420-dependent oxidoreductase [Dietzia cercidiphylli]MBB1049913.1 LLM class F420-dependent oxidoreductase [Dietzia sp. CW19]
MEFGLTLFTSDRGIRPTTAAVAAENAGFSAFYVPEHTHIPVRREAAHPGTGGAELPDERYSRTLDPWVALAAVSSVTSTIRLGTAVAIPVESDPITLAKTIASVDHLSGGRTVLGVGYGWNLDEMADHNVPPSLRRTMLREYLEAMRELWSRDEAEYHGRFVDFGPSWAWPKTVQAGGPRTLVGAAGNEKNFKWICRSADGWMTTPISQDIAGSVRQLRELWAEAGREGEPYIVVLDGKPIPEKIEMYRELGVHELVYGTPDRSEEEVLAYIDRLAGKLGLAVGT